MDVELAPGLINEMPPHTSMEFSKPPKAEGYSDYSKQVLHAIATGLGVTYEMLYRRFKPSKFFKCAYGLVNSIEMLSNGEK